MKCFYFVKHHKFIVFALALSFCFTFIRPISSAADDSLPGVFRFGYINNSTGLKDYFEVDQPLNLFQAINGGADQSYSTFYDQYVFNNAIRNIGLDTYFTNWDPYNPLFYVNVYCYKSDVSSYPYAFVLDFRKSSYKTVDYTVSDFGNQALISTTSGFTCIFDRFGSNYGQLISLPKNFYFGIGSSNFSRSTPLLSRYWNGSGNFVSAGSTYPFSTYNLSTSLSQFSIDFESFLSNSDYFSFSIVLKCNSTGGVSRSDSFDCINMGVSTLGNPDDGQKIDLVLSTFYVYSFDNVIYYRTDANYNSQNYNAWFFYLDPDAVLFPFDFLDPYTYGLEFIPNSSGILTPTPIPSPAWVSPTPLPTVTPVPISLTPIPQYLDPLVPGAAENIGGLNGYAGILDQVFSNFDIFALGSLILEYVYSFSGYFSFILIIPVICLIAFALGRLNQK